MRLVLLAAVCTLGLIGLSGCGDSAPKPGAGGGAQTPPPQDSGGVPANVVKEKGGGRIPKGPK